MIPGCDTLNGIIQYTIKLELVYHRTKMSNRRNIICPKPKVVYYLSVYFICWTTIVYRHGFVSAKELDDQTHGFESF